ncbi:hypothetical protein ACRYJA_05160, partial [Brucella anthropi]
YVRRTEKFARIHMPKNTGTGFIIGILNIPLGFALVWHIWFARNPDWLDGSEGEVFRIKTFRSLNDLLSSSSLSLKLKDTPLCSSLIRVR